MLDTLCITKVNVNIEGSQKFTRIDHNGFCGGGEDFKPVPPEPRHSVSYLSLKIPYIKSEVSYLNLKIPYINSEVSYLNLKIPHVQTEVSYLSIGIRGFELLSNRFIVLS